MIFDWDAKKALKNFRKHRVSFEIAVTVFDDPLHLSIIDPASSKSEERWITVGESVDNRIIVAVHTYSRGENEEETIRIISARPATKKETKQYEEGI